MATRIPLSAQVAHSWAKIIMLMALVAIIGAPAAGSSVAIDAAGHHNVQNLRQMALAMQNHKDIHGAFPGRYIESGGAAMLSWRVLLLPALGYQSLFDSFDLSKPWDDPANLPLLNQIPLEYRSPADPAGSTITRYVAGNGQNLIFDGAAGTRPSHITDGTSNTLLLGEALAGVPWTQPQDMAIGTDATLDSAGFSSITPGYVPFAFADGSVRFLPGNIDSENLRRLFVINDGLPINGSVLFDYVVVPEPARLAAFALGVLVLAIRRR